MKETAAGRFFRSQASGGYSGGYFFHRFRPEKEQKGLDTAIPGMTGEVEWISSYLAT